jgi:hypothetical protein
MQLKRIDSPGNKVRCWLARDPDGIPHVAMCVPNETMGWNTFAEYVLAFNPARLKRGRRALVEDLKRSGWEIRPAEVTEIELHDSSVQERISNG